jgi:hypothetical protein
MDVSCLAFLCSPAAIADPEPGVPHPDGGNEEEKLEKHKKGKAKKAAKPKYTQENGNENTWITVTWEYNMVI